MASSSFPPVEHPPARPRTRRKTAVGLVLMVLGTLLALIGPQASPAGAMDRNGMESIGVDTSPTNLANYPNGTFPAGCTAPGGQVLTGLSFHAVFDSVTDPIDVTEANMRDLPYLPAGSVLTMSWTGWVTDCLTPVSLATKRAVGPIFDATTDQALLDFVGCSPIEGDGIDPCVAVDDVFSLSLTMPAAGGDCSYQNDAVIGAPLDVVGPDGSFYGDTTRIANGKPAGPSMLISADNEGPEGGAGPNCQPPTAIVECGDNGAEVTVTNPDVFDDIFVTVSSGPTADNLSVVEALVEVTHGGGTATVEVPFGIGQHPFIEVVDAQRDIYGPTQFEENCATPTVNALGTCASDGSFTLTYNSEGEQDVDFTATINGIDLPLDGGGSTLRTLAFIRALVGDGPYVVEIFANDQSIFTSDPLSCGDPTASVAVDCAADTVTVTIVPGDDPTDVFVVTANGTPLTITNNVATTPIDIVDIEIVVTADGDEILRQNVEHCNHVVAACVAGKSTVERFTAQDVYTHYDGQFAVQIDEATGNWTSTVPIDFMMVVENNTTTRSFVLPGNFTSGNFTANTVTVLVNGSPVVVTGTVADGAGNVVASDVGAISSVTYCDGAEPPPPPAEVLGVQQTPPAALPRTGSEDAGRLALALGLVVTGLGLVLFGEDRRLGLLVQRR